MFLDHLERLHGVDPVGELVEIDALQIDGLLVHRGEHVHADVAELLEDVGVHDVLHAVPSLERAHLLDASEEDEALAVALVLGDVDAVGPRLLLVEFVRHAVEGCLDGGGEEVGLVVEDVSEDLTGGGAGRHGRADEAGAVGILARGTRAGVGRRSGTYREAVTAAREVAGARGEQRQ